MGESLFQCGAAKRKITPSEEELPNLFGLMWITFGSVMDDIYLRVIALNDGKHTALLISFDLDKAPLPESAIPDLAEKYGVPEENILYVGIHTHSAPVCGNRPLNAKEERMNKDPQVRDATLRYEKFVMTQLDDAVREALAKIRPAKMAYGYGESYVNMVHNQDYMVENEDGTLETHGALGCDSKAEADRTLFVCEFRSLEGEPIAFFINYPVHNVVTIANTAAPNGKTAITGDLGGRVSAYTEQTWPGSVAIWSSGAAGDLNACASTQLQYPDPVTGKPMEAYINGPDAPKALLAQLSARHFADVRSVVHNISEKKDWEQPERIGGVIEWSETPARDVVEHGFGKPAEYSYEGVTEPYRIRLHLLRIGNLALFGIGGELYSSLGRLIKSQAALADTLIVNHDASLICDSGYIYDEAAFRHSEQIKGGALGIERTRTLPGYIETSLEKHTVDMFEKVM